MNDFDRSIAELASAVPPRPSGLIPLVKRAPNSLRWRLIKAYWLLKREAIGMTHRIQGRRIVHLLHIGKTGGTALKSALKGYEHAGDYELALHEHESTLKTIPLGEKVIFVVRDPISRFVSGFYARQRQDVPRHNVPWDPEEETAFRRFSSPTELALGLSSDSEELRIAAADAIKSIQHLKAPQWTWFGKESYLLSRRRDILFIGFQENLDDDFELLKRILNLPAKVNLPKDEVAAHKNPASTDRRLNDEAIRNLKVWYAQDYRFFSLCQEIAASIRSDLEKASLGRITTESAKALIAKQ